MRRRWTSGSSAKKARPRERVASTHCCSSQRSQIACRSCPSAAPRALPTSAGSLPLAPMLLLSAAARRFRMANQFLTLGREARRAFRPTMRVCTIASRSTSTTFGPCSGRSAHRVASARRCRSCATSGAAAAASSSTAISSSGAGRPAPGTARCSRSASSAPPERTRGTARGAQKLLAPSGEGEFRLMRPTRGAFLAGAAGTAAAVAAPTLVAAASPADVASATRGMTFTTIRDGGVRTARGIIDVSRAAHALGVAQPPLTLDDVIAGRGDVAALPHLVANAPASAIRAENAVEYGPLVGAPPKIICVGLNYRAHIAETGEKLPPYPDLFNKYNTALNRHNGTVKVSSLPAKQFDYESELVMIVGKPASNVPEATALEHVFGYACGHDFTARDAQMRVSQWMTGKTPDQFAPIGPWLVTADQIPDPQTLQVQTFVNDETTPRQNMNTSQMIFSCAHIVSYTSQFITLQPGDVIYTGTPSGVIQGYPPDKRVWLKPGDRVRTVISKLGELHFTLA